MTDAPTNTDDLDLRPILGVIARSWQRIQPADLTADEAFSLLTILMGIENRLDDAQDDQHLLNIVEGRPKLRLI